MEKGNAKTIPTNMDLVASDLDKATKEAAASLEVNWEGCGAEPGVEVWRVENKRTGGDVPDFGIAKWPEQMTGEFYQGDSYIVLKTTKDEEGDKLVYDIYFWIGSESTQDEYGVAAYKANELDDLLGDAPVQHREVEGLESEGFLSSFGSGGIKYLAGGIDGGFRSVGSSDSAEVELPTRLFQVRRSKASRAAARCFLVPTESSSLNAGDAFLLDAGDVLYTWYGDECSPFERQKAVQVATALAASRTNCKVAQDDADAFWEILGGEPESIADAADVEDDVIPEEHEPSMYVVGEDESDGRIHVTAVDAPAGDALDPAKVALVDVGPELFVWIGSESSAREKSQAMDLAARYLASWDRSRNTTVTRVLEGQESRAGDAWQKAFA